MHLTIVLVLVAEPSVGSPVCGPVEDFPWDSLETLMNELDTVVDGARGKPIDTICLESYKLQGSGTGEYAYVNFKPERTVRDLQLAVSAYCRRYPSTYPWRCGVSQRSLIQHEDTLVALGTSVSEELAINVLDLISLKSKDESLRIFEEHDETLLEPKILGNPTSIRLEKDGTLTVVVEGDGCDGTKIRGDKVECGLENGAYEITSLCHHLALCD
ncbi:MAG: hypothetical protein ACJAUG_001662 [Halioglobus sp.]|jgi:hypothetical protein